MAIFFITLCIFIAVILVLFWVKTPRYLMQKPDVIKLLQNIMVGQASENDWAIFLSSSFRHDPELAAIRDACAEIDEKTYIGHSRSGFLFSEQGLLNIKQLLDSLR